MRALVSISTINSKCLCAQAALKTLEERQFLYWMNHFALFFSHEISFSTQISFSYIAILWFTSLPLLPPISLLNESFCSFFLSRNFFFPTNFFFLHCLNQPWKELLAGPFYTIEIMSEYGLRKYISVFKQIKNVHTCLNQRWKNS